MQEYIKPKGSRCSFTQIVAIGFCLMRVIPSTMGDRYKNRQKI
jgi:hypothetical protein